MRPKFSILLLSIAIASCAQKSGDIINDNQIVFESIFKPNHVYRTSLETNSNAIFNFEGPEKQIDQIKSSGVELPIKSNSASSMTTLLETGKASNDSTFEAVIAYEKVSTTTAANGASVVTNSPLSGTIIKGQYYNGKRFKVDTLLNNEIDNRLKQTIISTIENVLEKVSFPDTPMKVGDSFDQSIPLNIPFEGMNPISLIINTNYQLISIKDGIAKFDTNQEVGLDMSMDQANVTATGKGTGITEFDLKESMITVYKSNLEMEIAVEMESLTINGTISSITSQETSIEQADPDDYFMGYVEMDIVNTAKTDLGEETVPYIPTAGTFYYRNGSYKQVYDGGGVEYAIYNKGSDFVFTKFSYTDSLVAIPVTIPTEYDIDMKQSEASKTDTILGYVCDQTTLSNDLITKTFFYTDQFKIDGKLFDHFQYDNRNIFSKSNSIPLAYKLETDDYIMDATVVRIKEEMMSSMEFKVPDLPVKYIEH